MLEYFKPTFMLNSLYDLDAAQLHYFGIKNILTDLDNTLLPWNNKKPDVQLQQWFQQMKDAGIKVIVVSNNSHQRVDIALKEIDMPFIARAMKPTVKGIKEALVTYRLRADETVMVGDQLITDVFSGNQAGVRTILVRPLVASDGWNTSMNRFMEYYLFKLLKRNFIGLTWQDHLLPETDYKR